MEKGIGIFVHGLDKQLVQQKFEHFQARYGLVKFYSSWNPINSLPISKNAKRIDSSLLYKTTALFNAYPLERKSLLDKNFLQSMTECESLYFSSLDRCAAKKISFNHAKTLFSNLLIFYKSFFDQEEEISHVFFQTTPHFPVDIVLFYVAKYFGKKTIILSRTDFNNKYFFRADWSEEHDFSSSKFVYKNEVKLSEQQLNKDSKFVEYSKELNNKAIKNTRSNIAVYIKGVFIILKRSITFYLTRKRISPFYLNHKITWIEIFFLLWRRYIQFLIESFTYKKFSKSPTLDTQYIYFPLHFEPERSTVPEGNYFCDQLKALELLRETIPSNFLLYVKEHPRQFHPHSISDLKKLHLNRVEFYKKINAFKNTVLIDIAVESEELIKHAQVVVTITGSSGWQAIKQNKPAFIFGKPWYTFFENCFLIEKKEDVDNALKKINKNTPQESLPATIAQLENQVFDAYITHQFVENIIDKQKVINNFAENLFTYVKYT